jgi:1,4-dihydroxy-2-naphthoate octaprenyltransferase
MTTDAPDLGYFQRWMLAIRPKTLPAAIAPVAAGLGVAAALERFNWGAALAALFISLMIQIGANLVNDVADFYRGADTEARTGPTRVTHSGLLSAHQVWGGVFTVFGLAALVGVYLSWVAGWQVLVLGAACILAAAAYTVGPYPLAYLGLGDLFVMLFFGFAGVCGTVYVVAGRLAPSAWWVGAAVGALTVNILVVNNIRDIETDRQAGRKNIPVLWGRRAAVWEYGLMLALAYAVPLALYVRGLASLWVLLSWLALPRGLKLLGVLRSGLEGPPLNRILAQTAQQLLVFSLLLDLGLALGWMLS